MRISGGLLKGRSVRVIDRPGLRPTSARVREALFHRLADVVPGARVWDAFGGSGILSLESWSRGASQVVCTELDRRAARQIRSTAMALGAEISVRAGDARRIGTERFDLILADPPYDHPPARWLPVLEEHLIPGGVLVYEHRTGTLDRGRHGGLRVTWQRRYGDSTITMMTPVPVSSGEE